MGSPGSDSAGAYRPGEGPATAEFVQTGRRALLLGHGNPMDCPWIPAQEPTGKRPIRGLQQGSHTLGFHLENAAALSTTGPVQSRQQQGNEE